MEEASLSGAPKGGQGRPFRVLEHAWRHLDHLYEISKLLAAFDSVERTFPELMTLASQVVSLRTALLLEGVDSGGEPLPEHPHLTVWGETEVPGSWLSRTAGQAVATYAWLVGVERVDLRGEAAAGLEAGTWRAPEPPSRAEPSFVSLPLVSKGRVFGTLQVEVEGVLAEEGLAFIDAVANLLSAALDRHYTLCREMRLRKRAETLEYLQRELLARERQARHEAEEAHRRQAFLAEASVALAGSLDYRSTLPGLARLLVPAWADCCAIDLLHLEPGVPKQAAGSAERIALMAAEPPGHVAGQPSFVAQALASHPWMAFPASPENLPEGGAAVERAEWAGFPSNLRLPIRVRGHTLGALSLVSARSERYGPADVQLFESLVQRIATAVDAALLFQQAQEAVRWREELLAVVSHDIKTPLLVVRMNAEMLLNASRPKDEERRRHGRRHLETILQAAAQMRDLIGGVLDRARAQGMPMPLAAQPQEVDGLVQQALEVLRPLALEKYQDLKVEVCPGLPRVLVDKDRILQVLHNLVGNAIKFSAAGSTLGIRARQVDGQVRLSVKDNGPGIAPQDVPHLFERFWRAAGVSERGTGLGLSIVKSIVEAHGGSLWVETQVGAGSTFFFTLPVAK